MTAFTVTGPPTSSSPTTTPAAATASTPPPGIAPTAATRTPAASPAADNQPVSFTLSASGDILTHVPVVRNAARNAAAAGETGYDFRPMFTDIRDRVSKADLALCHLETPLSKDNTDLSKSGVMIFNAPRQVAVALKDAGFDGCDRVGNHVLDRGLKGIGSTSQVLKDNKLGQQGPSSIPTNGQIAVMYPVKGLKVAHLAYAYTALNMGSSNTEIPAAAPWLKYWMFPVVKAEGIIADAKAARAAGADVVVVSMHWGNEYQSTASVEQRQLASTLHNSPQIDAILGTHVHVVQPCDKINGKYVAYGMGNLLSNQSPQVLSELRPETQDGMVAQITFSRDATGRITQTMDYQPTHVRISDHRIELATRSKNPEAYARVTRVVNSLSSCDAKPLG